MAKKIAFENGQISNFKELVTLSLDRVILHTIMHYSQTSMYVRTSRQMDGHLRPTLLGRLRSRPKYTQVTQISPITAKYELNTFHIELGVKVLARILLKFSDYTAETNPQTIH